MQVKKQQLELDMEQQTGSKSGKEWVKAVYYHPAYLIFMQSTLCENARLDEAPTGIKIARRNINNLRYTDDTSLMAESEELKSLLMKVKDESERVGLKLRSDQIRSVAQSCPTLCNPMDCSPPGFSDHGILQARILEWIAIPFSKNAMYGPYKFYS